MPRHLISDAHEWINESHVPIYYVALSDSATPQRCGRADYALHLCNLVDPASSYTLVSKIKPCMYKYEISDFKLRMAH